MTMRYGTDEAEEGRRRLRRSPIQKDPRPVRIDPGGNVTPAQRPTPKRTTQPRAVGRQTVNQETIDPSSRGRFAPEFQRVLDRNATMQNDARAARMQSPMAQVGQIGGRVPSTRPQATPMPFAQQLVQSGMMNTQPIWDTSSGQGVNAPGYSVNPFHPMWYNPNRFANPWSHSSNRQMPGGSPFPDSTGGQSLNPMNYYWDNPEMPRTPRVWTGNEMTPQGFRGIMNTYGANVPWMRQNQMNPFGF